MNLREIAIFAKAPIAGQVKTRLAGTLGATRAALLQQQLTTLALRRATGVSDTAVSLWVSGPVEHPFVLQCSREFGVAVETQDGHDLGQRMHNAFDSMLTRARAALVIGTDCPAQRSDDLTQAFALLDGADAVIQPAEDGGYVLIGLRRPQPALFEGVCWGSDRVLQQTRDHAQAAGIRLAELPFSWDVDRPADLLRALDEQLIVAP